MPGGYWLFRPAGIVPPGLCFPNETTKQAVYTSDEMDDSVVFGYHRYQVFIREEVNDRGQGEVMVFSPAGV